MRRLVCLPLLMACAMSLASGQAVAEATEALRPRVPAQQLEVVRAITNPLPATRKNIRQGDRLYHGKAFCVACHGPGGQGIGEDVDRSLLKGPLPADFTSPPWQAARTDGELMWILKNGSPGTAMAPFVPAVLSEREAWLVIRYLRSLAPAP